MTVGLWCSCNRCKRLICTCSSYGVRSACCAFSTLIGPGLLGWHRGMHQHLTQMSEMLWHVLMSMQSLHAALHNVM